MTARTCTRCGAVPLAARLLVLVAGRHVLRAAGDRLDEHDSWREYAGSAEFVDRLTVERVATWLRRRAQTFDDAIVDLGESAEPIAGAADVVVDLALREAP